jgi:hypothetical protein
MSGRGVHTRERTNRGGRGPRRTRACHRPATGTGDASRVTSRTSHLISHPTHTCSVSRFGCPRSTKYRIRSALSHSTPTRPNHGPKSQLLATSQGAQARVTSERHLRRGHARCGRNGKGCCQAAAITNPAKTLRNADARPHPAPPHSTRMAMPTGTATRAPAQSPCAR